MRKIQLLTLFFLMVILEISLFSLDKKELCDGKWSMPFLLSIKSQSGTTIQFKDDGIYMIAFFGGGGYEEFGGLWEIVNGTLGMTSGHEAPFPFTIEAVSVNTVKNYFYTKSLTLSTIDSSKKKIKTVLYDTGSLIEIGSKTIFDNVEVEFLGLINGESKENVKLREHPSVKADFKKWKQMDKEFPYLPKGMMFRAIAKTTATEKIQDMTNCWYYIKYDSDFDIDYAWVYGEFISLSDMNLIKECK